MSYTNNYNEENPLEELGGIIIFVVGGTIIFNTWPFCIFFGIGLMLYFYTKNKKNLFFKAASNVLFPANIGLGLFCVLYLLINLFDYFSPSKVYRIEETFINLRLWSKDWFNISYLGFVLILIGLLLINVFFPHWKGISKYLRLRQYIGYFLIALTTLTSFTFFSQFPSDEYIAKEHEERVEKYEALLRKDFDSVGDFVSAELIEEEIREIEKKEIETYRQTFESIADFDDFVPTYNYTYRLNRKSTKANFINRFVYNQLNDVSVKSNTNPQYEHLNKIAEQNPEVKLLLESYLYNERNFEYRSDYVSSREVSNFSDETRKLIESIPENLEQKNQQQEKIAEKEIISEQNSLKAKEALKAVEALFISTVGLATPEAEDLGRRYIKKLTQECSKSVFKSIVVKKFGLLNKISSLKLSDFRIEKLATTLKPKWSKSNNSTNDLTKDLKVEYEKAIAYEIKMEENARKNAERWSKEFYSPEKIRERARTRARSTPRGR